MLLRGLLLATLVFATESEYERMIRARQTEIRREASQPNAPRWAGSYRWSDLAPSAGFVQIDPGCMGSSYTFGRVQVDGQKLRLIGDDPKTEDSVFWFVPWGERTYLVKDSDIPVFCSMVNDGTLPDKDNGRHSVKEGDRDRSSIGGPQVPDAWQNLLVNRPIEAPVLWAWREKVRSPASGLPYEEILVALPVGSCEGVAIGTGFILSRRSPWRIHRAYVERVTEHTCIARIGYFDLLLHPDPITTGTLASTSR